MKTAFTFLFLLVSLVAFSQKKLVATYSERPNNNGNFIPYDSLKFEYDANQRQSAWQSSYYVISSNTWKNLLRYEYTYNSNGDISSILVKIWSDTAWKVNSLNTYIYDNGLLKSINISRWYNEMWNNGSKTEYFYSTHTEPDSTVYYNFTNNAFQKSAKNIFTYNTDGNIIEDMDYFWDKTTQAWIIALRKSYTYNSEKLNTKIVYSEKAQVGWKTISTEEMIYDSDGDLTKLVAKNDNGVVTSNRFYFYDRGVFTTQPTQQSVVTVYPNPTSDAVFFTFEDNSEYLLTILTLEGKLIAKKRIVSGYSQNVTTYPKGVYFYSLQSSKNNIIKGKFMVK